MLCCLFAPFMVGSLAGGLAGNPNRRRPILRSIVKGGIIAKRKLEAVSATVLAETRNLAEEARVELDRPGKEQHN